MTVNSLADYPHVTVATVVHDNGHFLLVHENSDSGPVYNQPAGHLELNETLQQAALRETLEETGWEVTLTGFLGVSQYYAPSNNTTYVRISFVAAPVKQQPNAQLDTGIIEAKWFTIEQINALDNLRSPLVSQDLQRFLDGEIYPLALVSNKSF